MSAEPARSSGPLCGPWHIDELRIRSADPFLCDKPVSASRACTKMHLPANGQSGRSILLDCDKPGSAVRACTKMHLPANGQSGRMFSCPIEVRRAELVERCDLFFLVAERFCLLYEDFLAVAGEGVCYERFVRLGSDHGYDRDDHQTDQHAERACVDGGLQHFRKSRADQHVGEHEAD